MKMATLDSKIRDYFHMGYSYSEIRMLLVMNNDIHVSLRTFKRHLKRLGLKRRGNWTLEEIANGIQEEINGSGQSLGCRSLAKRLLLKHGMAVGRDRIMEALRVMDPDGIRLRTSHCLTRRLYFNKGPNFLIHIDGYDKLKPFGLAIHGAMCGYSRRILWLRVARTNNNPKVVAGYFLDYVQEINGVPRCIRADGGTENVCVQDMQKAFRWHHEDPLSGENSIIIGSSMTNQRIERWWRSMRQMGVGSWIDYFKDLEFRGLFSTGNVIHQDCVRFCFTKIVQQELDQIRSEWNLHNIRFQARLPADCPFGKPEIIFSQPELYGSVDYKFPVNYQDIETFKGMCETPSCYGCADEMKEHFLLILREGGRSEPHDADEAKEIFMWMLHQI